MPGPRPTSSSVRRPVRRSTARRGPYPSGRHDHTFGRVEQLRQRVKRDVAVPVVLAVGTIDRDAAGKVTDRQLARDMITDVAIDIGEHKILGRSAKFRKSGLEFVPVMRAI